MDLFVLKYGEIRVINYSNPFLPRHMMSPRPRPVIIPVYESKWNMEHRLLSYFCSASCCWVRTFGMCEAPTWARTDGVNVDKASDLAGGHAGMLNFLTGLGIGPVEDETVKRTLDILVRCEIVTNGSTPSAEVWKYALMISAIKENQKKCTEKEG